MASTAISSPEHTRSRGESGDLFDNPLLWAVLVLLAVLMLATVASFAVIYYGDDVHRPAWSERSVPPPTEP